MIIKFELDPDVNALYVRFDRGDVARTLEVEPAAVFLDVDENGGPLGMEFINADDFIPFIRRHSGNIDIPERVNEALDGMFTAAD